MTQQGTGSRKTASRAEGQRDPFIRTLYCSLMTGEDIEAKSFELINREIPSYPFPPGEWQVVQRMIHTTADFTLVENVRFSPDAIDSGVAALRDGRPIYVDSNMIRAGLSLARLRKVNPGYSLDRIVCHVGDEDVAVQAREAGLPRSLFAVRKAKYRCSRVPSLFLAMPRWLSSSSTA